MKCLKRRRPAYSQPSRPCCSLRSSCASPGGKSGESRFESFRLTGKGVLSEIEICHSHFFQKLFLTGWLGSSWSFFLFLLRMAGSGLEEAEDILPPFSDEIRPRAGRRPAIAIADDTTVSATEEKLSLARRKFREKQRE